MKITALNLHDANESRRVANPETTGGHVMHHDPTSANEVCRFEKRAIHC